MNFEQSLTRFLYLLEKRAKKHWAEHYPNLTPPKYMAMRRNKYIKVVEHDWEGGKRAYCWLNTNGEILKGDWKHIVDKRPRGNIFDINPLKGTNVFGVDYLV